MAIDDINIDDSDISYLAYTKHLQDDTDRKKNIIISDIEQLGGQYLIEIENKKKINKLRQKKLIQYILKHSNNTYTFDELMSYEFIDIQKIYLEIKNFNKSFLLKMIHFIFNIE